MQFHLFHPTLGAICQKAGLLLTIAPENVDCHECLEIIRAANIKAHQRRRKIADISIIHKVLTDTNRANLSDDDYNAYKIRFDQLNKELEEFNPVTMREAYVMGILEEVV